MRLPSRYGNIMPKQIAKRKYCFEGVCAYSLSSIFVPSASSNKIPTSARNRYTNTNTNKNNSIDIYNMNKKLTGINKTNFSTVCMDDNDDGIIKENSNLQSIQCYPCHIFFSDTSKELLQVRISYPSYKWTSKGAISSHRKGSFILDIASSYNKNNKPIIDWKNKISVSLSVENCGKVLYSLSRHKGTKIEAINDYDKYTNPKGRIVEFIISPKEDGCMILYIVHKTKKHKSKTNLDDYEEDVDANEFLLTTGDVDVLKKILQESIPYIIGWKALVERAIDVRIQNLL